MNDDVKRNNKLPDFPCVNFLTSQWGLLKETKNVLLLGACGCAAWWGTDKTQKYYQSHCHTVAGPLIAKADELPVHNRKGLGNQKEKGGGGTLKLEEAPLELFQHTVGRF
jgi:hypothetical protein